MMNWEKLCPYFKFNLNKIKKNIAFQTYCNELDIPLMTVMEPSL